MKIERGGVSTLTINRDTHFGIIYNDDSGGTFDWLDRPVGELVARTEANLKRIVDELAGTPVRTLCYCASRGGDIMNYRTSVGTDWGSRVPEDPEWSRYYRIASAVIDTGFEPLRAVAEYARRAGLLFLPSVRMNDLHFTQDPHGNPLTPEFWLQHPDLVVGTVPAEISSWYENAPDFSHPEVRQYKLSLVGEILDRFGDTIDGIELDFVRHSVYFPQGEGEQKGHLITEIVRQIRHQLGKMEQAAMRPYHLIVRVPTDLDSCRRTGLEVDRWLSEHLIDVLVPAPHYFTTYDMPIEPLVKACHRHGCKIYPSLFPKQVSAWPFDGVESMQSTNAGPATPEPFHKHKPIITPQRIRGAATNYWAMGVDGFAPFNFHLDRSGDRDQNQLYRILRDLCDPTCLKYTDKIFAITKPSWLSVQPVSFRKQLPADLPSQQDRTFELWVGEDLSDKAARLRLHGCHIRFGLRDFSPRGTMMITLNNQCILKGVAEDHFQYVKCMRSTLQEDTLLAECFVQMNIDDPTILHCGANQVTVHADRDTRLVDVELSITYHFRSSGSIH